MIFVELIRLGDMYDLAAFKVLCEKRLAKLISSENVRLIKSYSALFNAHHLEDACARWMLNSKFKAKEVQGVIPFSPRTRAMSR